MQSSQEYYPKKVITSLLIIAVFVALSACKTTQRGDVDATKNTPRGYVSFIVTGPARAIESCSITWEGAPKTDLTDRQWRSAAPPQGAYPYWEYTYYVRLETGRQSFHIKTGQDIKNIELDVEEGMEIPVRVFIKEYREETAPGRSIVRYRADISIGDPKKPPVRR